MKPRLPRSVIAFGVVSFLTDMSSEMIYPLLPIFVTTVLMQGAMSLGLIEGIADATSSLSRIAAGRIADRAARPKKLVLLGYGISGVARPLIGVTQAVWHVVGLRFFDRIGKGIRSAPRDALIAAAVPREQHGRAFGLHRSFDNAGAVLGPLIAAALLKWSSASIRDVFLLAAIPASLTMLVLWLAVPHDLALHVEAQAPKAKTPEAKPLSRPLTRVLVATFFFALANSSDAFLLLRLSGLGHAREHVILLWAALSGVRMVATYFGGGLVDRIGKQRALLIGFLCYAASYLSLASLTSREAWTIAFLVYGLTAGLIEPSERALVAELAPKAARGRAFGWFHGLSGLAALPASILFGFIWQWQGAAAAFGSGAVFSVLAALILAPRLSRLDSHGGAR